MIKTLTLLLFFMALFSRVLHASGTTQLLQVKTILGFGNQYAQDSWTPLTIRIENNGPPVNAALYAQVTQGSEYDNSVYQTTYSMTADLPKGARRIFQVILHIKTDTHPIKISLKHKENVLYSEDISLRGLGAQAPLNLVISQSGSSQLMRSLLAQDGLNQTAAPFPGALPGSLPEQWYGYDGIGKIIIDPEIIPQLSFKQYNALQTWVLNGGCLISSGKMNYGMFSHDRLTSLFGIDISGLEKLSSVEKLESYGNASFSRGTNIWLNRAAMEEGTIRLAQGQTPLILSRRQGDGHVVFIAFDADDSVFLSWKGAPSFWKKTLSLHPTFSRETRIPKLQTVLAAMMEGSRDALPGFRVIIPFAAGYVVLILLLSSVVPQKSRSKRIFYITVLTIATAFSVGSALIMIQKTQFSARATVFYMKNDYRRIMITSFSGIHSRVDKPIQVQNHHGLEPVDVVFPEEQKTAHRIPCEFQKGRHTQYLIAGMERFSSIHTRSISFKDAGLEYDISRTEEGLDLRIQNLSDSPITNGLLYVNNRFVPLPDIGSDTTFRQMIDDDVSGQALSYEDKHRLAHHFFQGLGSNPRFFKSLLPVMIDEIHNMYRMDPEMVLFTGRYKHNGVLFWEMEHPGDSDPPLAVNQLEKPVDGETDEI